MWCPGVILGPSNTQLRVSECLMWGYNMIFSQLNGDPCPAWTTERGKLKRGWSPGDSLNLVRVLSVRVNYSQQCRNDINGRWEYSKSIMFTFFHCFSTMRWYGLFKFLFQWKTRTCLIYIANTMAAGDLVTQGMDRWKGYEQLRENRCFIYNWRNMNKYCISFLQKMIFNGTGYCNPCSRGEFGTIVKLD